MKFIVRFLWFLFTATVYHFIDSAFQAVGTSSFLRLFIFFLYAFFVYLVPCQAFLAMLDNNHQGKCDKLSNYIRKLSSDFLKSNNIPENATSLSQVWGALLFTISPILISKHLQQNINISFFRTFSDYIPDPEDILNAAFCGRNDIVAYLEKFVPDPSSADGLHEIFSYLILNLSPDPSQCDHSITDIEYSPAGADFLSAVTKLSSYASSLFSR